MTQILFSRVLIYAHVISSRVLWDIVSKLWTFNSFLQVIYTNLFIFRSWLFVNFH